MAKQRQKLYVLKEYSHIDHIIYGVTTDGKVWSSEKNGYLSQRQTRNGYVGVAMRLVGGISTWRYVHRLVWEGVHGEIPVNREINHKDLDKTNNDISNLELVTHRENCRHARELKKWCAQKQPTRVTDLKSDRVWHFRSMVETAQFLSRGVSCISHAARDGRAVADRYTIVKLDKNNTENITWTEVEDDD